MIRSIMFLMLLTSFVLHREARGQGKATLAKEAAEYVLQKFGREAASEGMEALARKGEQLAVRYGDDALQAFRKVGPRLFPVIDEAGEQGADAVRLLAKYGDDGVRVAAKKERLAFYVAYGDDAAEALMKHGDITEPLLAKFGQPAATAVNRLSGQNARRMAMMADEGALARSELVDVIGRYGDRAMEFVWKNKGALATASVLAAFLADPEPFLDGTLTLTGQIAEHALRPISDGVARGTHWTFIVFAVMATIAGWISWKFKLWKGRRSDDPACHPERVKPNE